MTPRGAENQRKSKQVVCVEYDKRLKVWETGSGVIRYPHSHEIGKNWMMAYTYRRRGIPAVT